MTQQLPGQRHLAMIAWAPDPAAAPTVFVGSLEEVLRAATVEIRDRFEDEFFRYFNAADFRAQYPYPDTDHAGAVLTWLTLMREATTQPSLEVYLFEDGTSGQAVHLAWDNLTEGVDEDDNCKLCGQHFSNPHDPGCPNNLADILG